MFDATYCRFKFMIVLQTTLKSERKKQPQVLFFISDLHLISVKPVQIEMLLTVLNVNQTKCGLFAEI